MASGKITKAPGRPRGFDAGKALDAAMTVFWSKGYEGASLSDLTKAMRINRPSLYAAFGDKEALFRKVLDRYGEGPAAFVGEALREPTARRALEKLLLRTADVATEAAHPPGCLLVQGALACGTAAESVRNDLMRRRQAGEKALRRRLKRAQSEGELSRKTNVADLARYFMTVIHGMAVEAASGATRNELRSVAENALMAWPK